MLLVWAAQVVVVELAGVVAVAEFGAGEEVERVSLVGEEESVFGVEVERRVLEWEEALVVAVVGEGELERRVFLLPLSPLSRVEC